MENDVLAAIGEALIDFIPNKTSCGFNDVTAFSPTVGGAPTNVCGAFAKLGGKARLITQLGNDPFGDKIIDTLKKNNIDTTYISQTDEANTALAFVSLEADGNRTFSFYRKPSADMLFSAEQLDKGSLDGIYALHFCSVSLGNFPMRDAHIAAINHAIQNGSIISFDPNIRLPLWKDEKQLYNAVHRFIPYADILKISDEELEFICGTRDIEAALPSLFIGRVKLIVYTCGADGAYAFTKSAKAYHKPERVKAVDTTGAGDGFIGSFLFRLMRSKIYAGALENINEKTLADCLAFSNRFCAISVKSSGAIASYPTLDEAEA